MENIQSSNWNDDIILDLEAIRNNVRQTSNWYFAKGMLDREDLYNTTFICDTCGKEEKLDVRKFRLFGNFVHCSHCDTYYNISQEILDYKNATKKKKIFTFWFADVEICFYCEKISKKHVYERMLGDNSNEYYLKEI